MMDVGFIAIIAAFFAMTVLLVKACDRIIGHEEIAPVASTTTEDEAAA